MAGENMDELSLGREDTVTFGLFLEEYLSVNYSEFMEYNLTLVSAYVVNHSLTYRIVATLLHSLILIGGVFGNVVLILVAKKTRSLQTPTYCYLVSQCVVIEITTLCVTLYSPNNSIS